MTKKKKKNRKSKVKKLQALSLREVSDAVCKIKSANLYELDMLSAPMVKKQPHLCGTVVGLKLDGVTPEHIGYAWHLLLICYYACDGDKLPMLTMENDISKAYKIVGERAVYLEGEKDKKDYKETVMSHPEVNLFAYVTGYLTEKNITGKNDSEYHTLLVANTVLQSLHEARKKMWCAV